MIKELEKQFIERLEENHKKFDVNINLLSYEFSSPGYHTKLKSGKVHRTRESISYALELLDSNDKEYLERAKAVINKILSLQDKEESSKTYGIWSWFYEESLSQMSPPDWNWADFIGKELIQIILFHEHKLPENLVKDIKVSIHHAAYSIKRRDITPDYTNIHIMGSYVTFMAGVILEDKVLLEYGRDRLREAVKNLKTRGGFSEYNSPTYTIIAIDDISKMLRDFTDKEAHKNAEILNDAAWKMLGEHYHPSTGMLSAPHGRCYDDFMHRGYFNIIKQGISNSDYGDGNKVAYINFIKCPQKYIELFQNGEMPRYVIDTFGKMGKVDYEAGSLTKSDFGRSGDSKAITYMTEDYSIGSFNKSDLWNQRRPMMCYFRNKDKVTSFKVRALHNDYDYCSVLTTINQVEDKLICGLNFANDYGDTHINLDMIKNSTIKATNFKIRLEANGYLEDVIFPDTLKLDKEATFVFGDNKVYVNLLYYAFGNKHLEIISGQDDKSKWIDIILYQGEEREIDFSQIEKAIIAFAVSINKRCNYSIAENTEKDELQISFKEGNLVSNGIQIITKPDSYSNIKVKSAILA